jgi:hypothetical protein
MEIKAGDIYVERGNDHPRNGLVITEVSEEGFYWFDTSCMNERNQQKGALERKGSGFLGDIKQTHQRATPEQARFLLGILEEQIEIVTAKVNAVRVYLGQPKI